VAARSGPDAPTSDAPTIDRVASPLAQTPTLDRVALKGGSTRRVFDLPRPVALWHLASLDAPTVAVVWALAFAWVGGVHVSGRVMVVLALATWCAYVSDRILDARVLDSRVLRSRIPGARVRDAQAPVAGAGVKLAIRPELGRPELGRPELGRPELRERHYFHWRNRRLFVPLAGAAACVAAIMALGFLPVVDRERGSVLAAAALAYFSGVHAMPRLERWRHSLPRLVSKEFLVALLFTTGCMLPTWSRFHASSHSPGIHAFSPTDSRLWRFWIPGIYFAALAWLNCRSIAGWEGEKNFRVGEPRAGRVTIFGPFPALITNLSAATLLAFAGFLLAGIAWASCPRASALLAAGAVSALLLALLDGIKTRMTPLALRASADFVLLTPVLIYLR
jgi:hypothetical protein